MTDEMSTDVPEMDNALENAEDMEDADDVDDVGDEGGADEDDGTDEGAAEAEPIDLDDVEWEGKKLKLPKGMKEALLRHEDYTRKTMAVADKARDQEAAFQARQQASEQRVMMSLIDTELKDLSGVNMGELLASEDGMKAALQIQARHTQLSNLRNELQQQIAQAEASWAQHSEASRQEQIARAEEVLSKAIPNWGQAVKAEVAEYAMSLGGKPEIIAQIVDPIAIRVLHKAMMFDKLEKAAKPKKSPAEPVATVAKGKGGDNRSAKALTDGEWLQRREAELARKARRRQ